MRAKAYWSATLLFGSQYDVSARANTREIEAVEWCRLEDAAQRIEQTTRPEKAEVMLAAMARAERALPR